MFSLSAPRHRRLLTSVAAATVLALGAGACSNDSNDSVSSATPTTQVASTDTGDVTSVKTTLMTVASTHPFQETVDALKQAVAANGMMVVADLDQGTMMAGVGLQLQGAHSFFVGNPEGAKMLFEQTPAIGAVLPFQLHVWASGDGKTNISYFDPKQMFAAVDDNLAAGGQHMAELVGKIAGTAAGGDPQPAAELDARFITVDAAGSFTDTVQKITAAIAADDMMVVTDLDQAGMMQAVGLQLQGSRSLFAGNPEAGKMFFEQTPAIGAVLPFRFQVWADQDGKAHVSYFDPEALFTAVNPGMADGGKMMSQTAEKIAAATK